MTAWSWLNELHLPSGSGSLPAVAGTEGELWDQCGIVAEIPLMHYLTQIIITRQNRYDK